MYEIESMDAIVLGGIQTGETNRLLFLLTSEHGMMKASVRGVHTLKSKLRYALQDLTHSKISMVRGRAEWRITTAQYSHSYFDLTRGQEEKREAIVRLGGLIRRLMQGEGEHPDLFALYHSAIKAMLDTDKEHVTQIECIATLRIMDELGYIERLECPDVFEEGYTDKMIAYARREGKRLGRLIHTSLEHSQL